MPRGISRISLGDEIEVTVRGNTLEELKSKALDEAAAYFGVDREVATLVVLGSLGRPCLQDEQGKTLMYKATVKVRFAPEDDDD
jgi:hypothetical protein